MDGERQLAKKLSTILPYLNERQKRLVLAAEARSLGYGGVSQVARAAGVSRPMIHRGLKELDGESDPLGAVRRAGGGRKQIEELDSTIIENLEQLVDPDTRGDPMSPAAMDLQKYPSTGSSTPATRTSCESSTSGRIATGNRL